MYDVLHLNLSHVHARISGVGGSYDTRRGEGELCFIYPWPQPMSACKHLWNHVSDNSPKHVHGPCTGVCVSNSPTKTDVGHHIWCHLPTTTHFQVQAAIKNVWNKGENELFFSIRVNKKVYTLTESKIKDLYLLFSPLECKHKDKLTYLMLSSYHFRLQMISKTEVKYLCFKGNPYEL